ncbi:MAG: helix-turn-helix transcriptional regulator [Oscillospiraceae bacterium]|nr:helix-turn-helix transcriptional regulator [Oscillospiraceae bacterium]
MPRDKTASHIRVDAAIRAEFLEKGFEKASVRSIGQRAGMTSAGLYRHYADKEAMFASIVDPVIAKMDEWMQRHTDRKYPLADKDSDILFDETMIDMIKKIVLPNKEDLYILLCRAQGTRYENFIHDQVEKYQPSLKDAIHHMRTLGYSVTDISDDELHFLLSAYVTAIFEPIIHDYPDDMIEHYLDTINEFFMPGWKKIMGIDHDRR